MSRKVVKVAHDDTIPAWLALELSLLLAEPYTL